MSKHFCTSLSVVKLTIMFGDVCGKDRGQYLPSFTNWKSRVGIYQLLDRLLLYSFMK